MIITYQSMSNTIRTDNNCLVAWNDGNRWIFDLDKSVEIGIATKLFQRWQSVYTYAKPEVLAAALDDAINERLYILIGDRTVPVYWEGKINTRGIEVAFSFDDTIRNYIYFRCRHDIASNKLFYWFSKAEKRQEELIFHINDNGTFTHRKN